MRTLIAAAGNDPHREGLLETPARVARAYEEWFAGYAVDPAALLDRLFSEAEDYGDTILLRSIPLEGLDCGLAGTVFRWRPPAPSSNLKCGVKEAKAVPSA